VSRAEVAIWADGLIVEVHPAPKKAISDGAQSLDIPQFTKMMQELEPYVAPSKETARISPADPLVAKGPYYFYFGDKAKPKPSDDVYSQAFAKPGAYPVRVMIRGGHGHTIESDPQELVGMQETTPPTGWWERWGKYVVPPGVVALMCAFAGLHLASKYVTGLVGLRAAGRAGGVSLHQDGRDGLEAAFGFRLEQPLATAIAEFRGAVILKVERIA
jgi:hypothetical protein